MIALRDPEETDIREIVRRVQLGEPDRRIARDLDVSRNTVAHYRLWLSAAACSRDRCPEPGVLAALVQPAPQDSPAHEIELERGHFSMWLTQRQSVTVAREADMADTAVAVLIVDKFQANRDLLREVFGAAGYRILLAADGLEALQTFRSEQPELVVTSVRLPILSGIELLRDIRREDSDAAIIVMSGEVDRKTLAAARQWDAYAVVSKPVIIDELLIKAERALERRQLLIERRQYRKRPTERLNAMR